MASDLLARPRRLAVRLLAMDVGKMTLDEEIAWWTAEHLKRTNEIGFVAFGVATGLKMAKAYYGAQNNERAENRDETADRRPRPPDRRRP
jgi:hypothetical protein